MSGVDGQIERLLVGDRAVFVDVVAALAPHGRADQPELLNRVASHAAAGNGPALELLLTVVDEHRLDSAVIRKVLVRADDVDDVHQDVLIAVATSISQFAGDAKFTTWLHSVARNTAIAHFRRQAARGQVAGDGARPSQTPTDPVDMDALGPAERVSSLIATRASVREAIDALPPIYGQALVLRDIDGLGYDDIVANLGIGLNAAKSRVARARAMLATSLRLELGSP